MGVLRQLVEGIFALITACLVVALVIVIVVFGGTIFTLLSVLAGVVVIVALVAIGIMEAIDDKKKGPKKGPTHQA